MATPTTAPELRATYTNTSTTSPSEPFTLSTSLPPIPTSSASSSTPPTIYLRTLRAAVTDTQAHLNTALTLRMEEDKLRDGGAASATTMDNTDVKGGRNDKSNKRKKGKTDIDEEVEEMNYGEEVVEED